MVPVHMRMHRNIIIGYLNHAVYVLMYVLAETLFNNSIVILNMQEVRAVIKAG